MLAAMPARKRESLFWTVLTNTRIVYASLIRSHRTARGLLGATIDRAHRFATQSHLDHRRRCVRRSGQPERDLLVGQSNSASEQRCLPGKCAAANAIAPIAIRSGAINARP